jgi:FkbM family methyltransferase
MSARILRTARGIYHQVSWGVRNLADIRSILRYSGDVVLYHILAFKDTKSAGRERSVRLRGDVELCYRLNRGDIQSIREVWIDEVYRPPSNVQTRVVIDLGANIGLTSVYFARRCGASTILAVEPAPENCRIARRNFARNNVPGVVVEAAVGSSHGTGFFQGHRDSNVGRLASEGEAVRIVTMGMLMERTPHGRADLVKMDIEGGEGDLLSSQTGWLNSVDSMLAEFHPSIVDCRPLINIMMSAGFSYVPSGTNRKATADCFTRRSRSNGMSG